jgi:glyoxylase-like metal-dependent hydrolase (beta-lactamase superfamily II)
MRVFALELGPFEARCVVVTEDSGPEAVIVDPGFEPEAVTALVTREALRPVAIVLTHAHLDHAWGTATVKAAHPQAPVLVHADDLPLYRNLSVQAHVFGTPVPTLVPEDGVLADGQELTFGSARLLVRHCPGHSPGHVVFISQDGSATTAIVGDVLFAGSIGRTDLWGGSLPRLERSIRDVLYRLPDGTRVIPGHGPETTIGAEKAGNPFVPGDPNREHANSV